jgi:signal transduction histidine kinase
VPAEEKVPRRISETVDPAEAWVGDTAPPVHQDQETNTTAEAALGVERLARRAAESAQAEMEILYQLTDAVNRADSLEQVFETSLDAIRRALAIDRASILLYDDDGVMRFKAWRGLSRSYRAAVEGHSPWSRDALDPQPIFVFDAAADSGLAAYRRIFDTERIGALGFVPLVYETRLLGKFMLYSAEPRVFSPREVRIAQSIAHQIASAVGRKIAQQDRERLIMQLSEMVRENRMLATEASAANRAKDEFLAMLGHELRNPLSPIVTALQLMRLRGAASHEQEIIERQVSHLMRLVDDLLDVSRITRGKIELRKECIEIGQVVVRALEMASPILEQRNHQIEIDVPRHGLGVAVDPDRMAQVILNILTNAAKYSDRGAKIVIHAERRGASVVIGVKDEGIGIAPEMLAQIFDLFVQQPQTLDRARGGLGLGLAIVRSLVQMHDGTVTASSEGLGKGSELFIELPHVTLPAAPRTDPATVDEPHSRRRRIRSRASKRVLVVDDNDDVASTLADALDELGYDVDVARDGPSALEVAASFRPDVAILDIGLPVMDGYELARRLRMLQEPDGALRLVAITGYGQEEDRRRSEQAGFVLHLVKPVDIDVLSQVIEG